MGNELKGKKVAVLVADGFEEVEMTEPLKALKESGADAKIVSCCTPKVKAWNHTQWSGEYNVDVPLDQAQAAEFDALVLPGGVKNPDTLRTNEKAVAFTREFMASGKPVAAICHGPWTLIETEKVRGKKMTSYQSLKTDLKNAGATWVDEPVVVDHGLVTSRHPGDLPQFISKMIEEIAEGQHAPR